MTRNRSSRFCRGLLAALLWSLALPAVGFAQGGSGFLFRRPTITIKFETGYGIHAASSELFDFTREQLTIGKRDFDGPYIGGEVAFRASERWDVALGVGLVQSSVDSELRDWVDLDDNPIEQVSDFRIVPITLSTKYYFHDRGRSVGRFAWVPSRLTPYVGGGVGVVAYRFEQVGDFVDFDTLDIFFDRFVSQGEAVLFRGLAGVSISLGRQFELSGEARYTLASADVRSDFDEFDAGALDLNGFQGVVGIAIRF